MYNTLYTPHQYDNAKVEAVMAEMRILGAPAIRVVDCGDHYQAIEGVHRLEAATRLGILPNLVVLEQDHVVESASLDWQDMDDAEYTAGELAGLLWRHPNQLGMYVTDYNEAGERIWRAARV
jgi:hypothetical protein